MKDGVLGAVRQRLPMMRSRLQLFDGAGLPGKSRELIRYLERRSLLPYLVAAIRRRRPDLLI